MNRRRFLSRSSKVATVGALTAVAGCSSGKTVTLRISLDEKWSAEMRSDDEDIQKVEREGDEKWTWENPNWVWAKAFKEEESDSLLNLNIMVDGEMVSYGEISHTNGVARVSYSK
ncbi:hypothetical protein HZS55_19965 [Halosimplex rubrum]|uniref:Uncharacterized protein n=1 Tax=Halosimplex rubrum TaxID=869889 RepID=A0A7D5TP34_9EURY|nr:hypothetical protein [Halosimplex rubrum]QLH79432.1 hypothetical protein HZS55_19965 [Halosimplex rubrum]